MRAPMTMRDEVAFPWEKLTGESLIYASLDHS
jgi:hypothetical protein